MATSYSWEEGQAKLKKLRDSQCRSGAEVVEIWVTVLSDNRNRLGDDLWPIYEQVCIAACDCGRFDIAEECHDCLKNKFPNSMRVEILLGMCAEAKGKTDEATDIYENIRKKDETNTVALKRMVAIHRSNNEIKSAISVLNQYLKDYMADFESWNELCDLYLLEHDYTKAAFCMEECIMGNPHNHAYYQKLAEIKYTQGGEENVEMARKYYAQTLKINADNMRALYGLLLCASHLAATSKHKKENIRYAEWASKEIAKKYKERGVLVQMSSKDSVAVSSGQQSEVSVIQHMLSSLKVYGNT